MFNILTDGAEVKSTECIASFGQYSLKKRRLSRCQKYEIITMHLVHATSFFWKLVRYPCDPYTCENIWCLNSQRPFPPPAAGTFPNVERRPPV